MSKQDSRVEIDVIAAGKLRRYHHLTLFQHFLIPSIWISNLVDVCKVFVGFVQSIIKLIIWRPDVVFTKGGYVCLPVGWAANLLRIPLVIHDSDAHPGLTNRLLSKHAKSIATGAPLEYYNYPEEKSRYIGIPVSSEFQNISNEARTALKSKLGFDAHKPLIVITGGGLGAKRINDYVDEYSAQLTKLGTVLLISGTGQYDELRAKYPIDTDNFKLKAFISEGMADYMTAANVVVARAGATTILELAGVAVPTILVPNARLTGGHQLKNAKVYADANAALVVEESDLDEKPNLLIEKIDDILDNDDLRMSLKNNIVQFAKPDAAKHMAQMILLATSND